MSSLPFQTNNIAATTHCICTSNASPLLFPSDLTTAPGKLHVYLSLSRYLRPYMLSLYVPFGKILIISKHMSSQGFISLYRPGWIISSASGFLLRANAALSLKPGTMSGREPLAKGVLTLRGTKDDSFAV